MRLLAALLALCLPFAVAQASQEPDEPGEPRVPACRTCDSTGLVHCPEHDKEDCALEGELDYCSFLAGCEVCGGLGRVDCERCEHPTAAATLEARRARWKAAEPSMLELDATMGYTLRKGESAHFRLVWELDTLKVGRKRLKDHALLHLYLARLEELYDVYLALLGAQPAELEKKSLVLVWYLPKDQWDASLRFCSSGSRYGVKLMGSTPRFSVCGSKQFFQGDEELHRHIVHNVTHLLFSHQKPAYWIGQLEGGAWSDEGLAHWMEMRFFDRADTYCYQEQNTLGTDFKGGRYRVGVRKMVATGKVPPVAEVMSRVTNTLEVDEHAVAFSYVDYLLGLSGEKFSRMGRLLRAKQPSREALKAVYEMTLFELEERWKAWVLETYPTR